MATVEKKQNAIEVLKGVTLAYAKLAEPSTKYKSEDLEYSVDVIVDKATAKTWNKKFSKQKAKEYDLEEFQEKFKMDSPYDDDEVYVIKLKKGASKDGEMFDPKFRPKVLLDVMEDGVKVRTDITVSRLISNGTVADVSYRIVENDFGTFGHLQNVRIDEENFKEYISSGGKGVGSEFDDDDDVVETRKEPENENATKARAKKAEAEQDKPAAKAKAKPPVEDEDDDDNEDVPF